MGGGDGKVHSGGVGSGVSDALYDEREAASDETSAGLVLAKNPPKQRVITLQLNNHALIIPPRAENFRVEVQGTLPNDATLLSLFPHMHLRESGLDMTLFMMTGAWKFCCG